MNTVSLEVDNKRFWIVQRPLKINMKYISLVLELTARKDKFQSYVEKLSKGIVFKKS